MTKKRKKDNIDLICEELVKYNEEHGTSYSYGEYTALVGMGKIKSKYRNKRDIDLPLLQGMPRVQVLRQQKQGLSLQLFY